MGHLPCAGVSFVAEPLASSADALKTGSDWQQVAISRF